MYRYAGRASSWLTTLETCINEEIRHGTDDLNVLLLLTGMEYV